MRKKKYDIVIIGGGAMGLATAAKLANTSKKVLVLPSKQWLENLLQIYQCDSAIILE